MEQGTRLDSTPVSAAQAVRDDAGEDLALDAAVAALLTNSPDDARPADGGEGLSRVARTPFPEPGSPEAMALFRAACTETDRLARDAAHGYPELKRTPLEWWTCHTLQRALEAGEMKPAEFAMLYRLAFEREHRIGAAALATDIGSLQALAFAKDYARPKLDIDNSADLLDDHRDDVHPPSLLREIAAEGMSLANALIEYFGEEPIDKVLTTDIALRDHALRIRALHGNALPGPDAELIEIGQAWPGLVAEMKRTLDSLEEANEAYEAPEMPRELKVYGYDVAGGFPLPHQTANGYAPYGLNQIEELRATPRMGVFIGGKPEGELLAGGGYRKVDQHAQKRAEAIIAAWDEWRAEVDRRELALDIPALRMAARTATEAQDAAALRARALKAHTTRGLIAKAEIAAGVIPWRDRDAEAARRDADDEVGILYTLVSDALSVLGGRDPQLVRAS